MAQELDAGAVLWPESWRKGQFCGLRAKEETAGSLELGKRQLCSLWAIPSNCPPIYRARLGLLHYCQDYCNLVSEPWVQIPTLGGFCLL